MSIIYNKSMIGIDEVGRGAWAGPLLVCAARLNAPIDGLRDSKQLSSKKRQELAKIIHKNADIGYGWVSARVIDDIGLSEALKMGAALAVSEILPLKDEQIIIDGNINFLPKLNVKTMIRADSMVPSVSAASIAAKVARDELMYDLAVTYPGYKFEKHVGYGTKAHKEAIKKIGYCPEHRRCYKIKLT